ncbi:MAG TPA: hypothetical protein VGL61_13645 [Kofleriaceae bacterium]|jgi:hypothetical protein
MRKTPVVVALLSIFFACRSNNNGDDDNGGGDAGSGSGGFVTIQQVQDPSMAPGTAVNLQNVVVTAVDTFGTRVGDFWVEEPEGGPFSGVLIFPPSAALTTVASLVPGDVVTITGGEKDEFALSGSDADPTGRTDTEVEQITGGMMTIKMTSSGTVPAPATVDLNTIGQLYDPSQADTNGGGSAFNAAWQMWEGVLVTATNVDAFGAPKKFGSGGADQWSLDISGDAELEGSLTDITQSNIAVDTCLGTLTGVVDYFYQFLIYPRSSSDFSTGGTGCVFENAANGSAYCTDGKDNDGNGFTDCADLGCEVGANAYLGTSCVGTGTATCGCSANEAVGSGAAALQAVTGTAKPAMVLNSVVVSAVSKSGFWIADNATAASGHGGFVFTSSAPPATAVIGATMTVQGLGERFGSGAQTEPELEDPTVIGTPTTGATLVPATPALATATDITMGAPWVGSLVSFSGPFLITTVTTHDITMTNGTTSFTMADTAFPTFGGVTPVVGHCYTSLIGVMDLFQQTRTVNPRMASDMPAATTGTMVGATACL